MAAARQSTAECLSDFFKRYRWEAVQRFLAEFTNVEKSTVRRWSNGNLPLGAELLKVRTVLHLLGYQVEEVQTLPPILQQFGLLVALGLLPVNEAQELLGYKHTNGVYGMLLRGRMPLTQRIYRMERYVENSSKELENAVEAFRHRLAELPVEVGFEPILVASGTDERTLLVPPAPKLTPRPKKLAANGDEFTEIFVHLLKALATLSVAVPEGQMEMIFDDLVKEIGKERLEPFYQFMGRFTVLYRNL
jgi:hypothetical protein